MEGEVTMICVDTSIPSLCWFNDQIDAVKIYCERKLKVRTYIYYYFLITLIILYYYNTLVLINCMQAHPDNLVSIVRFGQRDLGSCLDPTSCLEKVTYELRCLKPLKQEYTDLLQGFKLFRLGWFGLKPLKQEYTETKRRIVVFSGG